MQYEPYGETLVQRGNQDLVLKYNSQELARETNFYFYNARYYDPHIGRFTSADSVIDGARSAQGWNRFSYVAGNPIRYKDPTGHEAGLGGLGLMLTKQCSSNSDQANCHRQGGEAFSRGAVEGARITTEIGAHVAAAFVLGRGLAAGVAVASASTAPAASLYSNPSIANALINAFQRSSTIAGLASSIANRKSNDPTSRQIAQSDPEINLMQQNGHKIGTAQYANRIKSGQSTSTWISNPEADSLTKEAWRSGKAFNLNQPWVKQHNFKKPVGIGPKGGGFQTEVKVSMNNKGQIHGDPDGPVYYGPLEKGQ